MLYNKETIHHLETGVPLLIIDEYPGDFDQPTRNSPIENGASSSFHSVMFMYGMFAGVSVQQFVLFGYLRPFAALVRVVAREDAESMAKILVENKMMLCGVDTIFCIAFFSAMYLLCFNNLLRFGFDVNSRSPGDKDTEGGHEDDKEDEIVALESTFALGRLRFDVNMRSPGEKYTEGGHEDDKEDEIVALESTFALGSLVSDDKYLTSKYCNMFRPFHLIILQTGGCIMLLISDWLFGSMIEASFITRVLLWSIPAFMFECRHPNNWSLTVWWRRGEG